MPNFAYAARGRDGKVSRGTLEAQNRVALIQALREKGLTPDQRSIKEKRTTGRTLSLRRVKAHEVLIFTRQLATMVDAGLPLLQSLDILAEQAEDPIFSKVIREIAGSVEGGETFSDALRPFNRVFPELYVSMVRAGEVSGDLDGVLLRLADYMEATAELKRRIRGAMIYPVVSLAIILMIASGLILFVVPQFQKIFAEMGAQLPKPTLILIQVSAAIRSWKALVGVAVVVAGVIGLRTYNATPQGRYQMDALKLKLPIFGMLLRKVAVSRFTRTLATLTHSGVAILQALEIAERTAGNEVFAKVIRNTAESVRNGETLADPLSRTGQFPPMVTRMIGVGEKTGAVEVMLEKIADFYDSEVKALVENMTSLIEPVLLVVMGVVVGGIIVALFMPILNLSQIVK
jgi:type IV pilus assembly protein PilC